MTALPATVRATTARWSAERKSDGGPGGIGWSARVWSACVPERSEGRSQQEADASGEHGGPQAARSAAWGMQARAWLCYKQSRWRIIVG